VSASLPVAPEASLRASTAGIVAAVCWGTADVLSKLVFAAGAGSLSVATLRGVVSIFFMLAWLRISPPTVAISRGSVWIALGVGLLFGLNVLGVYTALQYLPVPIAILTYFIYPLLTAVVGAAVGVERLTLRGSLAALVAFAGLALMIGASPAALAPFGLAAALFAAAMRVAMLLTTRALLAKVDARLTTWYSALSSTALLAGLMVVGQSWEPPSGAAGIVALLAMSLVSSAGAAALFASTAQIGAFRTALLMNLEPVVSTIGSMLFLGEVLTMVQGLGAAVMVAALCAFQLLR